jgi:hypothetical protein
MHEVSGRSRCGELNPQIKLIGKSAVPVLNQLHHDIQHGWGDQKTVPVQAIDLDGARCRKAYCGQII